MKRLKTIVAISAIIVLALIASSMVGSGAVFVFQWFHWLPMPVYSGSVISGFAAYYAVIDRGTKWAANKGLLF